MKINANSAALLREFDRCDPRVVNCIKEIHYAFKRMADNKLPEDQIMKIAVSVTASFQFTLDQAKRRSSPIILGR